jgi:hypothetical protein
MTYMPTRGTANRLHYHVIPKSRKAFASLSEGRWEPEVVAGLTSCWRGTGGQNAAFLRVGGEVKHGGFVHLRRPGPLHVGEQVPWAPHVSRFTTPVQEYTAFYEAPRVNPRASVCDI